MDPQAELLALIRDARARGFRLDDEVLRRELAQLVDQRQAEAMRLYWLEGRKQVQVAQAMGITQPTVVKLLRKGATNLAARIASLTLTRS